MRTQKEIAQRYKDRAEDDFLGFEVGEYVEAMDFAHAKELLKPEITQAEFESIRGLRTDELVMQQMREYVDFAYEKIDNERGISANRTICHYIAWIWLIGNDELLAWVEREYRENYHSYGRHIVDHIVETLKLRESTQSEQVVSHA